MSNVNPLRAEFVLTGLAFLASVAGLLLAWEPSLLDHVRLRDVEKLALPLTVGVIAAAYVVGIVVVQMTFFIPTESLIARTRRSRFKELRELEERVHNEKLERIFPTADAQALLLEKAFSEEAIYGTKLSRLRKGGHKDQDMVIKHAQVLAVTIGRAYAPAHLTDEYKYRRANRQVFVGILPSVIVGAVAGGLAVGPSWWLTPIVVIFPVALYMLWLSAKYQEEVAQSIILDVAFLRRWGIDTRTIGNE
jgi:hypothetical protein